MREQRRFKKERGTFYPKPVNLFPERNVTKGRGSRKSEIPNLRTAKRKKKGVRKQKKKNLDPYGKSGPQTRKLLTGFSPNERQIEIKAWGQAGKLPKETGPWILKKGG